MAALLICDISIPRILPDTQDNPNASYLAGKIHNGHMSASDDYAEHVFRVIYASVKQYFRNSKENDS